MSFQLWLGDVTLPSLIHSIADGACAVTPDLARSRAHEVADLIFRTRVRQTVACSRHGVCSDMGPAVWGGHARLPIAAGTARPCQFTDAYSDDLPNLFATAAANATVPLLGRAQRDDVEDRLATAFRKALAPYLFENEHCGHAPNCDTMSSNLFVP